MAKDMFFKESKKKIRYHLPDTSVQTANSAEKTILENIIDIVFFY